MYKVYFLHIWKHGYESNFDYSTLVSRLRDEYNGECWSEGLWFLYTDKTAKEIHNDIDNLTYKSIVNESGIYNNDIYFIGELGEDFDGHFFMRGYDWLKEKKNKNDNR